MTERIPKTREPQDHSIPPRGPYHASYLPTAPSPPTDNSGDNETPPHAGHCNSDHPVGRPHISPGAYPHGGAVKRRKCKKERAHSFPVHRPHRAHQEPGGYVNDPTPSSRKNRLATNKSPGETLRLPEDPAHKRIPDRRRNKRKARRQADAHNS